MIPIPTWLTSIIDLATDESKHFALAALMGLLACLSMWIILRAGYWALRRLTHKPASMDVVYGIGLSCLLVGLSFALASHWLLDYFSIWYVTPLGPGLDLIIP